MRLIQKLLTAMLVALPLSVAAQSAYVTTGVNVRAGPDSSYPLVGRIAAGTAVTVGGCLESYTWCDVYVGNLRGFVYATYIAYPYQSNEVPIYNYGPALGLPLITFSLGNYWDDYYRGRPFYGRRSYWASRPYQAPPPRFRSDWRPPVYHGSSGNRNYNNNYNNNYNSNRNDNYNSGRNNSHNNNNNYNSGRNNRDDSHNRPPQGNRGQGQAPMHNDKNRNNADGGEAGG